MEYRNGSPSFQGLLLVCVGLLAVVQLLSPVQTVARQASPPFTISWSLLKLTSIESDAIRLSHPLSSPSPSALSLSQHQGLFQ